MIVADTSVWIEYFRRPKSFIKKELNRLILTDQVLMPVLVKLEIFTGLSKNNFERIKESLEAFIQVFPSKNTFRLIENAIEKAISNGKRFSVADLTIAMGAFENNARVWSLDGDFLEMQKLGLVKLYNP